MEGMNLPIENNEEEGGNLIEEIFKKLDLSGHQCKPSALIERVAEKLDGLLLTQSSSTTPVQPSTLKMRSQSSPSSIKIPTSLLSVVESLVNSPT